MDDFGNWYQTFEWELTSEEWGYSISAYGGEGVWWTEDGWPADWAAIEV